MAITQRIRGKQLSFAPGSSQNQKQNGSQGDGVESKCLFRSSQGFSTSQCIGELMKEGTDPALARCSVPECHGISRADPTFREAL